MMKNSLFAIVLLLVGCTADEQLENILGSGTSEREPVPVTFSVSEVLDLTRASSSIVTFDANEQIMVCVKPSGESDYTGYTYTTASAGQSSITLTPPETPPYFPAGSGTTVQAYAYYPATAGSNETFSVQADQSSDGNYKASDLMFAPNRTVVKGSGEGNNLQMSHLMAQLHLNVSGSALTVNRVIVNAKRSVSFNSAAGTTTTTGSASNIIAKGGTGADTGAGNAYICIPKQIINTVTIKVETGNVDDAATTATFTFTSSDDFEPGRSYPLNLYVKRAHLGTTTTIADWNGEEPATVGSPFDVKKNPLWYVAEYNTGNSTAFAQGWTGGYYWSWGDALELFAGKASSYDSYMNAGAGPDSEWHMPAASEWRSIAPSNNTDIFGYDSGVGNLKEDFCTSRWGYDSSTKAGISETSWFKKLANRELHAVRFLGTPYVSLWIYRWVLSSTLSIAAIQIDGTAPTKDNVATWYSENIGKGRYRLSPLSNDYLDGRVQRYFYTTGYRGSGTGDVANSSTSYGFMRSTSSYTGTYAHTLKFTDGYLAVDQSISKEYGMTVRLFRDNEGFAPALGDKYYSDGTWGDNPHAEGAQVIGIVAWLGSDTDLKCGKAHGLVMALNDCEGIYTWGPSVDESYLDNIQSLDAYRNSNKNGLTNTDALLADGHTHAAASAARAYTPAAPSKRGVTNWFLPSAAQWAAVLGPDGVGKQSAEEQDFNVPYDKDDTAYNNIKNALTTTGVGGTALKNSGMKYGGYYWESTEYNYNSGSIVTFDSPNANYSATGVWFYGGPKYDGYYVRPFLAF